MLYEKVNRRYLPIDCFIAFSYNIERSNGTINSGPWGKAEEAELIKLAKKYDEHLWVNIAEELGTNRTPIDCLCHYQQALNVGLINVDDWSKEEEILLKAAVDKLPSSVKNWQIVANNVPGRTSYQCLVKWRRTAKFHNEGAALQVDGKWSEQDERRLFLAAIAYDIPTLDETKRTTEEINELYAQCEAGASVVIPATNSTNSSSKEKPRSRGRWSEVARLISGKNDTRCRDKWSGSLDNSLSLEPWSKREDDALWCPRCTSEEETIVERSSYLATRQV